MSIGLAPLVSHTATTTTTAVIIWDVSLYLYFVIEDTVSFNFGGVCVGIRVVSMLFLFYFILFLSLCVLGLLFVSFSLFCFVFSMFKD